MENTQGQMDSSCSWSRVQHKHLNMTAGPHLSGDASSPPHGCPWLRGSSIPRPFFLLPPHCHFSCPLDSLSIGSEAVIRSGIFLPFFQSCCHPCGWLITKVLYLNTTEANRSTCIHFSNVHAQNWNLIFCMEKIFLNKSWVPVSEKIPELNVQLFSILHSNDYTILTVLQIKKRSCPEGTC